MRSLLVVAQRHRLGACPRDKVRQVTASSGRSDTARQTRRLFIASFVAAMMLASGLGSTPVGAREADHNRLINLIDRQGMLLEKMSKETLPHRAQGRDGRNI